MKTDRFFVGMNPFGGICWLRIRKISEVLSRLKSNVGIVVDISYCRLYLTIRNSVNLDTQHSQSFI